VQSTEADPQRRSKSLLDEHRALGHYLKSLV
jgi:hypothetical protein